MDRAARQLKDSKTLRLFFSSPFGGMEEEREELTRKYFPQLQHLCHSRGIQFVPVDMRWGITTEAADDAQVINICLREIDRSDVFIGFFGQRYGWHGESDELLQRNIDNAIGNYPWLANCRGKSVTELEFLHGHLNDPGLLPASICFRDKAYDDAVRLKCQASGEKSKMVKYTAESEHSVLLMADLIRRVKETESKCLGLLLDYKDPNEGAKFMFESVLECCKELVYGSETQALSQLEYNRLCHDTFMAFRTSLFFGAEAYLEELKPYKLKERPQVLVRGFSGCGKSALLANLVKNLKETEAEINLIYHFVGCSQGTTDAKSILKRILSELQNINGSESGEKTDSNAAQVFGKNSPSSNSFHDIYLRVKTEMETSSRNKKHVLIIIDGIEKVKVSSKIEKHLYWLPEELPAGICLIVSTENSDQNTIDLLVNSRHFYELEIQPLETNIKEKIAKETLLIKGKELSPHQLERIVNAEQTKNPLFLKIVLAEISIYGYFRLLDKKIDSLIFSNGVEDLLTKVLERLEEDYNANDLNRHLVQQVLSAIAVSHCGLSEAELLDMFSLNSSVWSPFYFSMENLFIKHEGLLRFAFSEFENAVKERYLKTTEERKVAINNLIKYFEKQRKDEQQTTGLLTSNVIKRVAEELPYLQNEVNDTHGLIITLSDVHIFYSLERKSVYELRDLWTFTGYKQDQIAQLLFDSCDLAVAQWYNYQQDNDLTNAEPPGYVLMPVLEAMKRMFATANHHRSHVKTLQKIVNILEGIKDKIPENIRLAKLREKKYFLACAYVDNTEYDKAQQLHESVMAECRNLLELELNHEDKFIKQTLAYTCNGLGILHLRQRRFEEAETLLQESYELHSELENELSVAEAMQNLGIVKLDTGRPEVALEHFQKSMKVFESIYFGNLPTEVGNLLTNIALCYRRMNDLDKAEAMYQRSLTVKAQAVGWNHEVIATGYMNLGSLEFYRNNYSKAEEYTRKAINILEQNEVKLEQNEMWQAQENLVLNLVTQNKWDEALPIFLNVFKVLKQEKQIDQALSSIHKAMIRYLTHVKMFEEAADVAMCHINSLKQRQPIFYILLDYCDNQAALVDKKPDRSKSMTVRYALDKIWPGNKELTEHIVQTYLVPENETEELLNLVIKMDECNPSFEWSSYTVAEEWCGEKKEIALVVLKKGLEKYPDSTFLKSRLFDCLRQLKQYPEAYSLLKEVIAFEPNNQALLLVAGDVACKTGDLDLSLELWEKVSTMPDENLAQMAVAALKDLKEFLEASKENKT